MTDPRPIGVFDSGVGGLTVLRQIVRRLPGESTVYLGDNARAPYGTRTDAQVLPSGSIEIGINASFAKALRTFSWIFQPIRWVILCS